MGVDERKPGARTPMTEKAALDMLGLQRFTQQGIGLEIDHA
jgi:hypothetical protein